MSNITQEQRDALKLAVDCILDAAEQSGKMGAPSGVIYAAFSSYGMTLDMYQQILGAMERKNKIVVEHDLIYLPQYAPA